MKKLNWAILGTGWIAGEMGAALKRVNGEIYAVCNVRREAAEKFAAEYKVQKVYDDAAVMMADANVDIVYIATPHSLHYPYMMQALKAGKHVFCEKAITINDQQLEEAVALAQAKHLVICDGMTLFHMPLYKQLKEIVDSGKIGKVKMVQVNFGSCKEYDVNNRFFAKALAGGALLDIGVYAVSFARYFMTAKADTILTTANYFETGVDETSGIILRNPEGQMAVMALTMRAKQPKRGVIAGEAGYIEVNNYPRGDQATITYTADGHVETIKAGETKYALDYEIQDMQDYVLHHGGQQNLTYIRDVMATLTSIRKQWGMIYPFESFTDHDMDVTEFGRKISMLTTPTPLADAFDREHGQIKGRWWSSQREHLSIWCFHYPYGDVKGFEHTPGTSARQMYNCFGRPETLLWLAEALGEEEAVLRDVIDAIKDIPSCRTACAKVRKQIPFDRILALLAKQK